jgi:hypothetical protein
MKMDKNTVYYECYHCKECPTEILWNNNSHYSELHLPEAVDGGLFDCPNCGEVVCGEDLTVI